MKGIISFNGDEASVVAESKDTQFGRGVRLSFEVNGIPCNTIFSCHPEFENYDAFNSMTHETLFNIALKKLASGVHTESILEASEHKLTLLLVINGKNT
ncbi:hypothetical protein [Alteromonas stellipolaris]|uniref:hypothetical protein n=1 Tax=Alteromonas stellipolaris TaxID=233316 RepID=UPI002733E20B|nr:hypothetical protein [Alteromonas stellipolaris]MDP2538125.1 hypothetical protein [Alteromonas stellipolaris]